MSAYHTWREAHDAAQARANASGLDVGIRRMCEYGCDVFIVAALPAATHRYGEDLRAEVVSPTD